MSHDAITWAWKQQTSNSGQRLVLLALADHAAEHDDPDLPEGFICWPKIARLADMTGLHSATVRRHIDALVEDELVEKVYRRVTRGGRATTNVIRLLTECAHMRSQECASTREQSAHTCAVTECAHMRSHSYTEPLVHEPLEEPLPVLALSAPDVAPSFDDWYSRYPKKKGKHEATKAWNKLTHADRCAAFDGLASIEAQVAVEGNKYVPYASTWLNQRRWEDEPYQAPTSTQTKNGRSRQAIARLANAAYNSPEVAE